MKLIYSIYFKFSLDLYSQILNVEFKRIDATTQPFGYASFYQTSSVFN